MAPDHVLPAQAIWLGRETDMRQLTKVQQVKLAALRANGSLRIVRAPGAVGDLQVHGVTARRLVQAGVADIVDDRGADFLILAIQPGRARVECDDGCRAFAEPNPDSLPELRAALEHWRGHGLDCGCS